MKTTVILLTLIACNASAVVRYVDLNSSNPTPPYTDWSIAATNIQDTVDAAVNGDLILVTNGVYQSGGRLVSGDTLTNRLAITKTVTVQSVNGPAATVIQGYQVPGTTNGNSAVRCAYVTNGAMLAGFTLTGGATISDTFPFERVAGGGVRCQFLTASVSNCVIVGNSATYGGGACSGTLINCVLSNNIAQYPGTSAIIGAGGGAYASTLINCLIVDNHARYGGGYFSDFGQLARSLNNCTVIRNSASVDGGGTMIKAGGAPTILFVNNSIVFYNSAPTNSNYSFKPDNLISFKYSCTTPLPPPNSSTNLQFIPIGNFTNDPGFVDPIAGDFRLQPDSPCINSGNNAFASTANDFDNAPRITGGTVDVGAYEFQSPSSILSYVWAQQNGLPTDGSADYSDSDSDASNNWQEWIAGTVPTDSLSVLKMFSPSTNVSGLNISWQSVSNRTYFLQRSTDLSASPSFATLQSNIVGQAGTTVFTDNTATNSESYFYRVGVQ